MTPTTTIEARDNSDPIVGVQGMHPKAAIPLDLNDSREDPLTELRTVVGRSLYTIDRSSLADIISRAVSLDVKKTVEIVQQMKDINQRSDAWYMVCKSLAKESVEDAFEMIELAVSDFGGNLGDHLKRTVIEEAAIADLDSTLEYLDGQRSGSPLFESLFQSAVMSWMTANSDDWRIQLDALNLTPALRRRAHIGVLSALRRADVLPTAIDLIETIPDQATQDIYFSSAAIQLGEAEGIAAGVSLLMGMTNQTVQANTLAHLARQPSTTLQEMNEASVLLESSTQYEAFVDAFWAQRLKETPLDELSKELEESGIATDSPIGIRLRQVASSK